MPTIKPRFTRGIRGVGKLANGMALSGVLKAHARTPDWRAFEACMALTLRRTGAEAADRDAYVKQLLSRRLELKFSSEMDLLPPCTAFVSGDSQNWLKLNSYICGRSKTKKALQLTQLASLATIQLRLWHEFWSNPLLEVRLSKTRGMGIFLLHDIVPRASSVVIARGLLDYDVFDTVMNLTYAGSAGPCAVFGPTALCNGACKKHSCVEFRTDKTMTFAVSAILTKPQKAGDELLAYYEHPSNVCSACAA